MWLVATIVATLLFGIYPVFADRAGRIHGEKMNFVIDAASMAIMATFMAIIGRADFARITKVSFGYALGLCLTGVGFFLSLYALRIAPEKIPVIMAIIGFSTILPSIIYNFMGTKLSMPEWVCVAGATFFIVCLCFLQKRV